MKYTEEQKKMAKKGLSLQYKAVEKRRKLLTPVTIKDGFYIVESKINGV